MRDNLFDPGSPAGTWRLSDPPTPPVPGPVPPGNDPDLPTPIEEPPTEIPIPADPPPSPMQAGMAG